MTNAINASELRPPEGLPSVRQLSARLRVNPATVVQAYRELEAEGFVEMRQGAGTFVRELPAGRHETERAAEAARLVRGVLTEAARLGLAPVEIRAALERELAGAAG